MNQFLLGTIEMGLSIHNQENVLLSIAKNLKEAINTKLQRILQQSLELSGQDDNLMSHFPRDRTVEM